MSQRRPVDVVRGLRETRRSMGDGTMGGRSRIPTPRTGGATPLQSNPRRGGADRTDPSSGSGGHPRTVLLEAHEVEVEDDAEDPIPFDEVIYRQLIDDPLGADPDEIVWPHGGTVMFWFDGEWADLAPGGSYVEVLVDGEIAWAAWIIVTSAGLTLTVVADDVEVADDTPVPVTFDRVDDFGGIERNSGVNVDLPDDEIVWPVSGVVQFYAHGIWDTEFTGDVEYEVLVDEVPVWPEW